MDTVYSWKENQLDVAGAYPRFVYPDIFFSTHGTEHGTLDWIIPQMLEIWAICVGLSTEHSLTVGYISAVNQINSSNN